MRPPQAELQELQARGLRRELRPIDGTQGAVIESAGRRLVNFASNDYLGFANHPQLNQAFAEAVARWGSGAGSSRLLAGTLSPHTTLENAVASLKQAEAARCFSSGYAAAVGSLGAVLRKGDVVILDKLAHASLIDGARLSGATLRVFPHNRLDKLAELLTKASAKRSSDQRIVVVTESVFSMDGDLCPLPEIVELKDRFGAWLLLDEAHAFGLFGPRGAGLAAAHGLAGRVEMQLGTFSKAAGLAGAYLAASRAIADLLTNRARSFIYSTAPPPALAAAARHALDMLTGSEGEKARSQLDAHRSSWQELTGNPASSPIIPVLIGASDAALAASARLESEGFLAPAVRYPTVPKNQARLRISLSAGHSREQVTQLAGLIGKGFR